MSADPQLLIRPRIVPPLDPRFLPAVLFNNSYLSGVRAFEDEARLQLGLVRPDGSVSSYETIVHKSPAKEARSDSTFYAERLAKFLLWQRGASRLLVAGPRYIGEHLAVTYSPSGDRAFDHRFMSQVYNTPFTVEIVDETEIPAEHEPTVPLGRHLEGCRIGFDLGASDFKVSAVIDGNPVYADEFPWLPRDQNNIEYHYGHITSGLRRAAEHLPRVDAIGGSSAGVWIDDRVRVASLFRGLSKEAFENEATTLFSRIRDEWNVPLNVVNDGEVTALAGSMSLGRNAVLGIAMGSSEAAGYVTTDGNITRWLNELAFAPIDYQSAAPADEWSGDVGCGVQYFCQTGVIRLAEQVGISLNESATRAQKLRDIQDLLYEGDERIPQIYETIGVWLGYGLAHYAEFYDIAHVVVLGRVTSGAGGEIIVAKAKEVLATEFPNLAIELHVPDERMKRIGQSVAAASLPKLTPGGTT